MNRTATLGVVVWALVLLGGLTALGHYQGVEGAQGPPPSALPEIPGVQGDGERFSLLIAIHPHCPCTQATAGELERLLGEISRRGGVLPQIFALVYRPAYMDTPWTETTLRDRLRAIEQVTLVDDPDGRHGASIGALTSGHTVLFDAGGHPVYRGGLTASRGHEGDNIGKLAVINHLLHRAGARDQHAVYGCELTEDRGRTEGVGRTP